MRDRSVPKGGLSRYLCLALGLALASCSDGGGGGTGTAGTTGRGGGTGRRRPGTGGGAAGRGGPARPARVAQRGGRRRQHAAGTSGGAGGGSGTGGALAWTITSPNFTNGAAMPNQFTCNGGDFASGDNPELNWTAGPSGTMSYAIVLKDLTVIAANAPTAAAYNRGFHWVIWDIPTNIARKIAMGMGDMEFPPEVPGSRQWANRNQFGYFPPCPNSNPTADPSTHVTDTYSLTLYAINKAILDYPAMDPAIVNYSRTLHDYIESVAIGKTEIQFTSNALSNAAPRRSTRRRSSTRRCAAPVVPAVRVVPEVVEAEVRAAPAERPAVADGAKRAAPVVRAAAVAVEPVARAQPAPAERPGWGRWGSTGGASGAGGGGGGGTGGTSGTGGSA